MLSFTTIITQYCFSFFLLFNTATQQSTVDSAMEKQTGKGDEERRTMTDGKEEQGEARDADEQDKAGEMKKRERL